MGKHKVFLVEDEPDISELIQFNLNKDGYSVSAFPDGESLLEKIKTIQPDLLILDIMLPGMDGFDVCRMIRKKYHFPILFLSAKQEEIDKVLGFELGADDYLTKPFSIRELLARVKTRLKKPVGEISPESSRKVYGPFEIDKHTFQIYLKKKPLDLTKNEFQLLNFFLENPKRVFTRLQLLESVWNEHYEGYERAVDGSIKRLRKKINKIDEKDYIKTVRGFGYQFE